MLKKLEIYSDLKKTFKKNKNILDVVLFGSSVRGKLKPNDIDLCIIFKDKVDHHFITGINSKFENLHISALTIDNFFAKPHTLIRTLLLEGISLFSNKKLSNIYGLNSYALYNYNLSKIESSKKVRFIYLLKGRKNAKGIIENLGGEFLSPASFMVPINKDTEIVEIFNKWNIQYNRRLILLML